MAPNPLLRIRSNAKKTFGEVFGAATGVSDPRLQKTQTRNHGGFFLLGEKATFWYENKFVIPLV